MIEIPKKLELLAGTGRDSDPEAGRRGRNLRHRQGIPLLASSTISLLQQDKAAATTAEVEPHTLDEFG